jgi:hypothetical protein
LQRAAEIISGCETENSDFHLSLTGDDSMLLKVVSFSLPVFCQVC